MSSGEGLIEIVGIFAVIVIVVCAIAAIAAVELFKRHGLPIDDEGDE